MSKIMKREWTLEIIEEGQESRPDNHIKGTFEHTMN